MNQWILMSVKNQTMGAMYHHRKTACADRFSNSRMGSTVAPAAKDNNRGRE